MKYTAKQIENAKANYSIKFTTMKNQEITIKALQLKRGHIILAVDNGKYYVKDSYGVTVYTAEEMKELYDFSDNK